MNSIFKKLELNKNIYQNDDVDGLENYLENKKFHKVLYALGLFFKSKNILIYIVVEKKYIEDYYQLYKVFDNDIDSFLQIKNYYLNRENDEEEYYFFSKYVSKLIKKNRKKEFVELWNDNIIDTYNDYNVKRYCKTMILEKCTSIINLIYDEINSHNVKKFIIKLCIDLNLQSNIKYFCNEFIIHDIYYETQINNEYFSFESLLDYSLYRKKTEIFNILVDNQKINFSNICYLHFYTEEEMMKILKKIKLVLDGLDKDSDEYKNVYFNHKNYYRIIVSSLFKEKLQFNPEKIFKYLIEEFPNYFCILRKLILVKNGYYNHCQYSERFVLDTYTSLCLYCSDINIHQYFIDKIKNTNLNELKFETKISDDIEIPFYCTNNISFGKLHLEDYFHFLLLKQDTDFIKTYIKKFNIIIKPKSIEKNLYNINIYLDDLDNNNLDIKIIINNIKFLIDEYDMNLSTNYNIISKINYIYNLEDNIDFIINFYEEYNIIERYFNNISDKSNFNLNLKYFNNCKCKDRLSYQICKCNIDLNFSFEKKNINHQTNIYKIINSSIYYDDLFKYVIKKLNFKNIILCENSFNDFLNLRTDLFEYFRSFIDDEFYQKNFININFEKLNFRSNTNLEILEKLIKDGLDINKYKLQFIGNYYIDYEDLYIFDLLIKYGLNEKCIKDNFIKIIKIADEETSDIILEKYMKFCDDDIEKVIYKNKRYGLINYLIKTGRRLNFKIIKEYKLDIKKICLVNMNDIEGEKVCLICMVNVPSVIFVPCGHMIACKSCSLIIENICPCDKLTIDNKYILKGKNEEELTLCFKCKKNEMEFIYENCGHVVCKKCCFKSKCSICYKKSTFKKIYQI
jgi:hypothetical protein